MILDHEASLPWCARNFSQVYVVSIAYSMRLVDKDVKPALRFHTIVILLTYGHKLNIDLNSEIVHTHITVYSMLLSSLSKDEINIL